MNIYLIGMPGSGKSTVGKELAKAMNYNYIDLDSYIERKYNDKIPNIFEKYGESKFREFERYSLSDFMVKDSYVISCGGGIVSNISNKDLMNGVVVFIDVDIETLKERISNDKVNIRPMFLTKTVEELYDARINKYNSFKDITVKNVNVDQAVKDIIKEIDLFCVKKY